MNFGSLFTGIGGFDLGFERAGMECLWQVENDKSCVRVLERHWPNVRRYGDIAVWQPSDADRVDVACGGFPCQDVSVAGQRAGLAGERSGLYWHAVRVFRLLQPAFVVLENVPGLLSSHEGRDFALVLGGLAGVVPSVPRDGWGTCGLVIGAPGSWSVAWRVLDSQYFGVAQRRRRVFLVGHSDPRRAAAVLFDAQGGGGTAPPGGGARTDVAYCLDGGAGGVSAKEQRRTLIAIQSPRSTRMEGPGYRVGGPMFTLDHLPHGVTVPAHESAQQQRSDDGSGGASGNEAGTLVVGPQAYADGMRAASGLPGPLDLCPSCQKGPDAPRYRQTGNAVTVSVAEWIGRRIMEAAR